MAFHLLSEPIRRFVRNQRWEELRPIQAAAISKVLSTDENYILASRTASGKTEAAFLPILTLVDFRKPGVQVLYISPLIALINDQLYRIEQLCKYLDVVVTKWHGEASKGDKDRLIKEPSGIVLITPESLEAMFVNKPYLIRQLFGGLKFVVIDEIHSFIGSDRGVQLKSILCRIQQSTKNPFRTIGLSATIGDYDEAKRFTGNEAGTKVLLDRTAKEVNALFRYFPAETEDLPLALLKDLYLETKDNKVLLFPNSRGKTEEVAVKLKKIAERVGGHTNYFSHHSAVDKGVREFVEAFAKANRSQPFLIACTSTLELGIDIGSVDEVVQIDATHSIASLIQRMGRSGRREGQKSNLFLYATRPWSLVQSLACWLLHKEGYIEPPPIVATPYDILLHQMLSIVKGSSGIDRVDLVSALQRNYAFEKIDLSDIHTIVDHLIQTDMLEQIGSELILGMEGEGVVNSRDFYSVFSTEDNFKVINAGNTIGEVPYSLQIIEGEHIMLAARIWKIQYVDTKAKKIEVVKAIEGKKPQFFGSGVSVHSKIREKMLEIVYSRDSYEFLDDAGNDALSDLRQYFSTVSLRDRVKQRPVFKTVTYCQLFTFSGTRINRTVQYLLILSGIKAQLMDDCSLIEMETSTAEFFKQRSKALEWLNNIDAPLANSIESNPALLDFSKWGMHLPIKYKVALLRERYFDFEGAKQFLETIYLVTNLEK